jgi:hypothetical protein
MAPLNFPREQAGQYNVLDGVKLVGCILKKSSSKWILYKCSNPSMLGNPIAVKKTLKELKVEAEKLISSTSVNTTEVNPTPNEDFEARKFEMMREMLNRDYVIKLNEYQHTEEGLEEVQPTSGSTDTVELVEAL